MSNRCPDCNKFVSLNQEEPEVNSVEVDEGTQTATADVRLVLTCADCGGEMKEAEFTTEVDFPSDLVDHIEEHHAGDENLEIEEGDAESTERWQDTDAKGKRIPYRYQKHFYGYSLTATIRCACGDEFAVTFEDEEQASGFYDLN